MKRKSLLSILLLLLCICPAFADGMRTRVENGIAGVERLVDNHQWREAFTALREVDGSIGEGNEALHYLVMKQRFRMYSRINKSAEAKGCMQNMEALAMASNDEATIEDMLLQKANYNGRIGNIKMAKECYTEILNRRTKGKDFDAKEKCFKKMIEEAAAAQNVAMKNTVTELYTAWQDSIATEKAAMELKDIKAKYVSAQEEISSQNTKIGLQWGAIILLAVLLIAVSLGLAFFVFLMLKNTRTIKKLGKSLKISNENNAQKSVFMRNIASQISPSLKQIANGNARQHIDALSALLSDVEHYMELEESKEELYETKDTNVGKLCEDIVAKCSKTISGITTDAPKIIFPVNPEAVTTLLENIIGEASKDKNTERIVVGFKKRNPHTAQFSVTAVGMKLTEEEKETIFTAFAKIYDLTTTTGLVLPTCSLMAFKMGGNLSIDNEFAKGTRFNLEVHC